MIVSAVILAGGQSRRMGSNKAWLDVEGQPLIIRALSLVHGLGVKEVFLSARSSTDYPRLCCPILVDRHPSCGPLGGIERGLAAATSPFLLVLAVDLPHMTISFLRKLAGRCDNTTGVVPRLTGRFEPLAAFYPKRCHTIADGLIRQSRHPAGDFARACVGRRAVRAYPVAPAEAVCLVNWNSPYDLSAGNPNR